MQFTEQAIREAFVRLLNEKPLDKITIRDIPGSANDLYAGTGDPCSGVGMLNEGSNESSQLQ